MAQQLLEELFKVEKPIIGMVHFLPLPGSPLYDERGGVEKIFKVALRDALILERGGINALLFCNEGDRPYSTSIPMEVVSTYSALVSRIVERIKIPFGINVLFSSQAAMAIAHATGASFIRGFLTHAYVGDMGIMDTQGAQTLRLRKSLGAERVRVFANVTAGFAVPLAQRSLEESVKGAVFVGLADALCVSGPATGTETKVEEIIAVKKAVPNIPVIVGSGVKKENVERMLKVADGVIVGTGVKLRGETLNPVDPRRLREFMKAVENARRKILEEGRGEKGRL